MTISRFDFRKEQKSQWPSKYNFNQGVDGFTTFQKMNIAPTFLFYQLIACLRMKFGNVEAVGRLLIRKKKNITRKDSFIEDVGSRFDFGKEQNAQLTQHQPSR